MPVQAFRRHEKQKKTLCIMHYKGIHRVRSIALYHFITNCNQS